MHSFEVVLCSFAAVEVKKEPEPPTEIVKQEEREPATKSSAPAPPTKPPPEKRARLQWPSSPSLNSSSTLPVSGPLVFDKYVIFGLYSIRLQNEWWAKCYSIFALQGLHRAWIIVVRFHLLSQLFIRVGSVGSVSASSSHCWWIICSCQTLRPCWQWFRGDFCCTEPWHSHVSPWLVSSDKPSDAVVTQTLVGFQYFALNCLLLSLRGCFFSHYSTLECFQAG